MQRSEDIARIYAIQVLVGGIKQDSRFNRGVALLRKDFPDYFPLTRERLESGVPFTLILGLSHLANQLGFGRLKEFWELLLLANLDHLPAHASVMFDSRTARQRQKVEHQIQMIERDVRFLQLHVSHQRTYVSIAFLELWSEATVRGPCIESDGCSCANEARRSKR